MFLKLLASGVLKQPNPNEEVNLAYKLFKDIENKGIEAESDIDSLVSILGFPYECLRSNPVRLNLRNLEDGLISAPHYKGAVIEDDFV